MKKSSIISSDPERMGGVPVFEGTRVPIQALFDNLAEDGSLENFLYGFPTVSREMVIKLFEELSEHFNMHKNWLSKKKRIYPLVKTKITPT